MDEQEKKYIDDTKEYWQGFPEAPVSDTFKWVDLRGYEHMLTIRGLSPHLVMKQIGKTLDLLEEIGGHPAGQAKPAPTQVQERVDGLPVVNPDGKPVMINLPDGTAVYTVKGFYHGQNKAKDKDFLKVVVVEKPYDSKYGFAVFHPPFSNWKDWPLAGEGTPGLFAAPEGCGHVIMGTGKDPKFPEILEFRA